MDTLKRFRKKHGGIGDGNLEGVVGGGSRRKQKTASDDRRRGSDIGDGRRSGERRTPCGKSVFRYAWTETGDAQVGG